MLVREVLADLNSRIQAIKGQKVLFSGYDKELLNYHTFIKETVEQVMPKTKYQYSCWKITDKENYMDLFTLQTQTVKDARYKYTSKGKITDNYFEVATSNFEHVNMELSDYIKMLLKEKKQQALKNIDEMIQEELEKLHELMTIKDNIKKELETL